jgi:hypothetical protein
MKGIITVKILLSITTILGILPPMLPVGFCFLGQINHHKKGKAGEGATHIRQQRAASVTNFYLFPLMTEHYKNKKNDEAPLSIKHCSALVSMCICSLRHINN